MGYLIKITDGENKPVRLCVQSQDLTNQDLIDLQARASTLFNSLKDKPLTTVTLNDIKNNFNIAEENACTLKVRKLQTSAVQKKLYYSYSETLRRLIEKEPDFTCKCLWTLFIAPFIAIYRYFTQNQAVIRKLHRIFGSEIVTHKQFIQQIKRMCSLIEAGLIDKSSQENETFLSALRNAVEIGKKIQGMIEENGKNSILIAQEIYESIKGKNLFFVPATLKIGGVPTPLLFCFKRNPDLKWTLEIKGLPEGIEELPSLYKIMGLKPEADIKNCIQSIVSAVAAENYQPGSKGYISWREETRLQNLMLFGHETLPPASASPPVAKDSASFLNEMFCNFAVPQMAPEGEKKKKDFFLQLLDEFESFFPHASSVDKVEWLLASIEEQASAFFAVEEQITTEERLYFFKLLEQKVHILERSLGKKADEKTRALFAQFYVRLNAVNGRCPEMRTLAQTHLKERFDADFSSKQNYAMQVHLPEEIFSAESVGAKKESGAALKPEHFVAVETLKNAVASGVAQNVQTQMAAIHALADQMIEQKAYGLARDLALLALSALPVPSEEMLLWSNQDLPLSDHLSRDLTALVKDVWESSIRLNFTYPQPEEILQLLKAQVIQAELGKQQRGQDAAFDYHEMNSILHFHPHMRFGWKSAHFKELKQINAYIQKEKGSKTPQRIDGEIGTFRFQRYLNFNNISMQRTGQSPSGHNTDFVRLQVMVTSLIKPDYCMAPFFSDGRISQARGLMWLDGLEAEAVANGAKTKTEIREGVKLIRLKEVQERLSNFRRLELGRARYVTEYDVVTIIDTRGSADSIAYLPNGYGLPNDFEEKYGVVQDQNNTKPLVGAARGTEKFLSTTDNSKINISTVGTLSSQYSYTEPSQLALNLQKPPRGQISQTENYLLESIQLAQPENVIESYPLNKGSIVEAFNLLFNDRGLANPEVQRAIVLLLTRSFLLEELLQDPNSFQEMRAIAFKLRAFAVEKISDPIVFPFLLQIGQIVKDFATGEIADLVPCFDNVLTINGTEQTGKEWLEEILKDQEIDRAPAAIAYLYALAGRSIEDVDTTTLGYLLFSASLFKATADAYSLPMFNRMVEKWIEKAILPGAATRFQSAENPPFTVLDEWLRLSLPLAKIGSPSPWKVAQTKPMLLENGKLRIHLPSLEILSMSTGKPVNKQEVILPPHIQRNNNFLKLFGNKPIRAELARGDDPNKFVYTFSVGRKQNLYRAVYDQTTGKVEIFSYFPTKEKGKGAWFIHLSRLEKSGESTVELAMAQRGLWVNQNDPTQAYLIVGDVTQANEESLYSVRLNSSGQVKSVKTETGLKVAVMTAEETEKTVPFANGQETLILLGKNHQPQEVRCLNMHSKLVRASSGWSFVDPRLGTAWNWESSQQNERFLSAMGDDHHQFLLPLTHGKAHQFLVLPYEIKSHSGKGLSFDKKSLSDIANDRPITLSIGKDGELIGSPSSFLYLAYYFGMKKDYERAQFYLKKAKKVPAHSDGERIAFEKIAALFGLIPYRAPDSLAFQLKAQLTIRSILNTQFSRTSYNRESENQYVANVDHIERLFKLYQAKKKVDVNMETLSAADEYSLERIRQVSFNPFVEHQKTKDAQAVNQSSEVLPIDESNFQDTKLDLEMLTSLHRDSMYAFVLFAIGLNRKIEVADLVKKGLPDAEHLVRHFFHFYNAIANNESPQTLLNYLLAPPRWRLHAPRNEDEKQLVLLAEQARKLLIAIAAIKVKDQHAALRGIDFNEIKKAQSSLPYWGRETWKPVRFLWNLYDVGFLTKRDVDRALNNFGFQDIIQTINDALHLFTGKTVGEFGGYVLTRSESEPPQEKQSQGGVSLATIVDYFQNLPADRTLLPIEKTEIPRLIEKERDVDMNRKRDMSTYMRESEAHGFSILQFRAFSEQLLEIQQLETSLAQRAKARKEAAMNPELLKVNPEPINESESRWSQEAALFANRTSADELRQEIALNNLEQKYQAAIEYFNPNAVSSAALKEEYAQIQLGLETARQTLQQEICKKAVFTSQEVAAFKAYLEKHLDANINGTVAKLYLEKRRECVEAIGADQHAPKPLKKMLEKRDLYSDFDLLLAVQKLYKDPKHGAWFNSHEGLEQMLFECLLYMTAYQQLTKAAEELEKSGPAKALEFLQDGLKLTRYFHADVNPMIARKCLVAEARAGIIYRSGQRHIISEFSKDPAQWVSLKMGEGKTSYAMPTVADILAELGKKVVITVPQVLVKQNHKDMDHATRNLFDQADLEFSMPLVEELPINYLAEMVVLIEKIFLKKGYIITTVEELCTLHNTCILLEDDILKMIKSENRDESKIALTQIRLHFYKKIDGLLNGDADQLNLDSAYFGDETDETHDSTHEVSIARGEKRDPAKELRLISRTLLNAILSTSPESSLNSLKKMLIEDTYPILNPEDVILYMRELSIALLTDEGFLSLLGERKDILDGIAHNEWADYMVGLSGMRPEQLPEWSEGDPALQQAQKIIGATKQILSKGGTFASFLSQKTGNDLGLSDFDGFAIVPKITKNETEGQRFADRFDMTFAQYLGYLEFFSCQSLTDASINFLGDALKTFKEKSPRFYKALLSDYHALTERLRGENKKAPELIEYLISPEAYQHRWNILDDVIFDGGYIKEYEEQIRTNVQEIFHRRPCGGVTGTLDPYVLPFISEEVQLHHGSKESTRKVEAETLLRLSLNVEKGMHEPVLEYSDDKALERIDWILAKKETVAFINSNGASSEGMNTQSWIGALRKRPSAAGKNFLFRHPTERIDYIWRHNAARAVPFHGALPENTVCIYAPSDVRGVDLKIPKGEVHLFVSPTATLQQYSQTLYRARQIGGDHKVIQHISNSLYQKIQEKKKNKAPVTYGDVSNYIVERPIQSKLERNLNAQLLKVNLELKTVVTRFLKETNPRYDQHQFWNDDNVKDFGAEIMAKAALFEALRSLYIQGKEIDFKGCYAPREFISGVDKVLEEFDHLKKQIELLLDKVKEASLMSASILIQNKGVDNVIQELQRRFTGLFALAASQNPEYKTLKSKILNSTQRYLQVWESKDPNQIFECLAETQRLIVQTIQEVSDHDPAILEQLQDCEKFIRETLYGPGRSFIYNTLLDLYAKVGEYKKNVQQQREEHAKYLPQETTRNRVGNAGNNEQVKELQQQKVAEQESVDTDPDAIHSNELLIPREYEPLAIDALCAYQFIYEIPKLSSTRPFSQFYISSEAKALLEKPSMLTGDPLVYVAVSVEEGQKRITLISKQDYHLQVRPRLTEETYSNLAVYAFLPNGVRWLNGGKGKGRENLLSSDEILMLKAYLGYKEEFTSDNQDALHWKNRLSPEEAREVLAHVNRKGTPSQRAFMNALLNN